MNRTNLKILIHQTTNAIFLTLLVGLAAIDQPKASAQSTAASTELKRLLDTKECVGCNLSGVDLDKANLQGAKLEKANLTGANTSAANF